MRSKIFLIRMLVALIACLTISTCANDSNKEKGIEPVIYIQDGAIDEMMVPMLLKTMDGKNGNPNIDLKGVVVVDGDCWAFPTAEVQWKLNALISPDVPVGISTTEAINPFPSGYRNDCLSMDVLPILNPKGTKSHWTVYDGEQLIINILENSPKKVTILLNCGATPVSTVLQKRPDLESKISRMIWMGGAIKPDLGNVVFPLVPTEEDPQVTYFCEWNMYWDPTDAPDPATGAGGAGAGWLLENTKFPIILFPLDITDSFPLHYNVGTFVENEDAVAFHEKLVAQADEGYLYSQIALDSYNIPYNETWNNFYCLWDTVSAVYFAHPEYYYMEKVYVTMETAPSLLKNPTPSGHINVVGENEGREILYAKQMADGVKKSAVYDYMAAQYKR